MKLIITVPAYNEERTIGRVIKDIKDVMNNASYNYKILVVNDGSRDRTEAIARSLGAVVYSHPRNYGLAETFRTELKKCLEMKADIIVHTDADGQYLAKEIPLLVREVEKGNELVLGSRFIGKIEYMPWIKKIGNKAFSKAISQIIGMRITDSQTGFRAFTKEVAKILITSNHTYTQEQIIRASKEKFRIKEIPVYFAKRGAGTKSRLMKNSFEYALKAWINILRVYRDYEPLKFFGYIGSIFILTGIFLGILIIYNILTTGDTGGIPRVVLSALALLTGLQIWVFGFLADMNRK